MLLDIKHNLLYFKYKAHLQNFTDDPSISITTDSWQEVYPTNPNFYSFNMMTKHDCDLSFKPGVLKIPNLPT